MIEHYPTTLHGIPVNPLDIWLPETNLNPEKDKNYNNHHSSYYARMYGGFLLYQVFHDLASNQQYLLRDVHSWIHEHYGPPEMPKPLEALVAIEQAWDAHEVLQIRREGEYIRRPVTTTILQCCIDDYDNNRGKM